ncbi:hypothetical protein ABZ807_05480 [Micromonospora sp. NPDC047548]|uniref:hypothetical protein n=1 Tax=Micromonospora sp. NPDC047548 TaxID=3155624 RepID=UPI00340986BD
MTDTAQRRRTPVLAVISAVALIVAGLALAAVYVAQGGDDTEPAAAPAASSPAPRKPAPKATADPYKAYLRMAPDGAPNLSREDAQARALLGCGQKWAPGTVDAALAEAYADLCKQGR